MNQTFHFDFNHLGKSQDQQMFFKVRGSLYPLLPHNSSTLAEAAKTNKAAAMLLKSKPEALTHFAQIGTEHFFKDRLTRIQVVGYADDEDPENYLPPLYHVAYVPHIDDYISYFSRLTKKTGLFAPPSLHAYGLTAMPDDDPWQHLIDQYNLQGPVDVANFIAGQHPMTMSNKPQTHLAMLHEHIFPTFKTDPDSIAQCNNIIFLAQTIKAQGQPGANSGFARVRQSTDSHGNKMTFGYDLDKRKVGDAVLIYDLTKETNSSASAAAAKPVQTSRNDPQFKNQTWSVNQGQSSYDIANQEAAGNNAKIRGLAAAAAGSSYSVSPNTSTHGVSVDQGSISFDDSNNFSINANNNFLRIVGAYVEFFSDAEMKNSINLDTLSGFTWPENMPSAFRDTFESSSKKYLKMISSVNTILGIPMPTSPTTLKFPWPGQAQGARLQFGGVGTWNYDKNIVWPGFIETGIFDFGIPVFMMASQAMITDTQWYKEFIEDSDKVWSAIALAFSAGSVAFGVDAAFIQGLTTALFTFGDIIAGILVSKALAALSAKILERVAASEMAESVPFVGWVLRIASVALDGVEIAVSLGEVLSSPAVIEVEVKRQMTFDFNLHPDPAHGEAGKPETAIWPAVADHYRILVNYQNGTGFEAKGQVPLTKQGGSSNSAIPVSFIVPWGGKLQVLAMVYSKSGWLCGKYQSDWLDAVPDSLATGIKTKDGNIKELLVPLTVDTQYNFMQKISYSDKLNHYWFGKSAGATVPTDTVSSLNPGNEGNNIAALSNITINETAYVMGYTWQASGENIPLENNPGPDSGQMFVFQNLSVLSDPESRMKFPPFGFKTKPGLAYDIYGGSPDLAGPLNFVIDTRNATAGYVRLVNLLDGSNTFDLNSGQSYGIFSLGDIDDLAVHPNGYLIAVNWASHKMQILKLSDEAVDDAAAPQAMLLSGKGVEQGLLNGPLALAISPDAKIYILESLNNRVQAFDIAGNPAPSFPGQQLFTISKGGTMAPELDQKTAPPALIEAFISNGATNLFGINDADSSMRTVLDAGVMTQAVLDAFSANMIYLAYQQDSKGHILPDPAQTSFITVVIKGSQWNITDPTRNYVYILTLNGNTIQVQDQFTNTELIILQKGNSWQLKDLAGGDSFLLTLNGNDLQVAQYLSYFSSNPFNEQLNYCDIAIESKGYVYVLSFTGDPSTGAIPNTAYVLDVYTPQGVHLFRSPDSALSPSNDMEYVAAGKITLDLWRNLFAMNYEKLSGPAGRTEPSVSQWIPTPPLFSIVASTANVATFDSLDIKQISALLISEGLTLSANASCIAVQAGAQWSLNDTGNSKKYDVINSIGQIYVYNIQS